jgi:predicted acylesterase/phospholipase RssA
MSESNTLLRPTAFKLGQSAVRGSYRVALRHPAGSRVAAALLLTLSIAGCGGPSRPTLTDEQLQARSAADMAESVQTFEDAITKLVARTETRVAEAGPEGPVLNVLAISGGGDFGAFGAGFLVGWACAPGGRPDFDVVTGVSTGALLAPFAYVGTDETCTQVEQFYRDPQKDWVRDNGLLFFLPSNPSFMTIPGLDRDIRRAVDRSFIERMAAESRNGKVLVISATDLDFGRQKFWDVGDEAEKATDDAGVDRVQRILLSSAAIPAVFPPVAIGDAVYADGGVTANVFLRLEHRNPRSFLSRWRAAHPDIPVPRMRYWIIVNNQVAHQAKTVQLKWPSVMGPSLATAIRSATIAEIRWLAAEADYVNAVYGTDVEVRTVAIPDDWRAPVRGDFQKETMASLAQLGQKMGADPNSWKVWASRELAARYAPAKLPN